MKPKYRLIILISLFFPNVGLADQPVLGTEGYASSGDVKIHYVTKGEGPLVVLIHGFPDYWYTWREQIPELSKNHKVVAVDQRGYNKSGQPEGVENYSMDKLAGDIGAVIRHFGREKAVIVGHDWGGAVAWTMAAAHPQLVDKLIILNLPHPHGIARELANNPQQRNNSAYARQFQKPDAAKNLSVQQLAGWVKDPEARQKYVAAFNRSSLEGMLNYYKANYPKEPYEDAGAVLPKAKCPVLMIHGLQDKALLASGLNDTWEWVDNNLTIVTVPNAGHFVQQDAPQLVTHTIVGWLRLQEALSDASK